MKNDFGKFFKDFKINQKIKHYPGKTITESDNNLFCLLTMNHHPVHLDQHYAKKSKHKKILVNGLLIISTVVGMTVRDISGKAVANLEYNKVIHHNPTFLNDTLYAETKVISKKLSKNKKNGVVHVKTKSLIRTKNLYCFERKVLVPRKV